MPTEKIRNKNNFLDTLQAIVISLAISIFVYLFIATPNQVDGLSMYPTFNHGELLLTNRVIQWLGASDLGKNMNYEYGRGDVVVFQEPGKPDYVKRIIGIGKDKISIKDGKVFINDKEAVETYLEPGIRTRGASFLQEGDSKVVPENSYFVMGDNRGNSQDSRYVEVGFVKREYLKGKVMFRYFPFNRFGIIETGEVLPAK